MQNEKMPDARQYARNNKRRRAWRKIMSFLACVIVFCTTYALILPAITMEKAANCELEEHTHSEKCYNQIAVEQTMLLTCTYESLGVHSHTLDCYDADGNDICTIADYVVHIHDESCYDETVTLICRLPEMQEHTHSDSCYETVVNQAHIHDNACYTTERGALICQNAETEGHVHEETCYETQLVCAIQETEGHTHIALCYEQMLICTLEESEGHQHTDACYEQISTQICELSGEAVENTVLACTDGVAETHVHSDSCVETYRAAAGAEVQTCGIEESDEHTHTSLCYGSWELVCKLFEHTHDLICFADTTADLETESDWKKTFADTELTGVWADDLIAIAKSQLGYTESTTNYTVLDDGTTMKGYTRYGDWYGIPYGDWCAMFVSFCLHYAQIDTMPLDSVCQNWIATLNERGLFESAAEYTPKAGDLVFFDWESDGHADHVGIVTDTTQDGYVNTIEGNRSDMVKTESYALTDSCLAGYGLLPVQLSAEEQAEVDNVVAMIDAMPSADEIDAKIAEFEEAEDYEGEEAWLTEIYQQVAKTYYYYNLLSDDLKSCVTNADKLLELEYIWSVTALASLDTIPVYQVNRYDGSSTLTVLVHGGTVREVIGSTMDFAWWTAVIVEEGDDGQLYVRQIVSPGADMYKYDYGAETDNGFVLLVFINTATVDTQIGDPVTVTFQYQNSAYSASGLGTVNFGVYMKPQKDNTDKLDVVESADTLELIEVNLYDFGSNINDLYNSNQKYPGFQQDNGTTGTVSLSNKFSFNFGNNITKDLEAGKSDLTNTGGDINATASTYNGVSYGTANIPLEGTMRKTLLDGYPALADDTSLAYLFTTSTYATKQNTANINGLFRYNATTGAYTFNSRENHAQFDASTNTFTLYKQIISSNFIMYPFGNFLPFNDITKQSTQASTIDSSYFAEIANSASYRYNQGAGDVYSTLSTKLKSFISLMDKQYGSSWTAYDAVNAYFSASGISQRFSENSPTLHGDSLLDYVYSIDYDEATNFYFGMEMKMNFMQPKDGLTGLTGKEEMIFYFTGDDDVWIYVDDVLFLDLSGIHRHVGGEIDFVNGKIHYYNLDVTTGDVATTPYKTVTFEQAFREAYAADPSLLAEALATLNDKGTFKNYSTHSFSFYYMERGAGSGVCRMNFNFPMLRQNSISVSKVVTSDVELIGDPDYRFQILKANADGEKTDELFLSAGTPFTIYDESNNLIGTGTVDANGVFTLKAGQLAEFVNIDENKGKYFVRELLEGTVLEQYSQVTVSGESTTVQNNVTVGSESFTGMVSPVKDMSDGATVFWFTNDVDESKLGKLTISKQLTEYSPARTTKTFDIEVKVDGELLPVGTGYLVGTEQREVETAGIITIMADETAEIASILAGSTFVVKETSDSAEGYVVTYMEDGQTAAAGEDGVTGVIKAGAHVELVVRNSEQGTSVTIPGSKSLHRYDGAEHTYTLRLTEVTDNTGMTVKSDGITDYPLPVTVSGSTVPFEFTISYMQADMEQLPGVFYYRITEDASTDGTFMNNDTVYVVEVTVSESSGGTISATVSNLWRGTMGADGPLDLAPCETLRADFVNTLTGSLTLSKTVSGMTTDREFGFAITLAPGDSGLEALSAEFSAVLSSAEAESQEMTVTFTDGRAAVVLKHGQSLTILGVPYGAVWTVTETDTDGFRVTTQVTAGDAVLPKEGPDTNGSIVTGDTMVEYTNAVAYELPKTGGAGTTTYAMAGLVLMLCSAAFLLYRIKKRRREAY